MTGRPYDWALAEPGVAGEADGVGRIPPDAPVGRDTDEGRTDLASRSLNVPGSANADPLLDQAVADVERTWPGSTAVLRKDGES